MTPSASPGITRITQFDRQMAAQFRLAVVEKSNWRRNFVKSVKKRRTIVDSMLQGSINRLNDILQRKEVECSLYQHFYATFSKDHWPRYTHTVDTKFSNLCITSEWHVTTHISLPIQYWHIKRRIISNN